MKKILVFPFLLASLIVLGQSSFNDYAQIYPIGEDPNIRHMSSYSNKETILFEANPVLRLSVYNNFMKGLLNGDTHTQAWYLSFRPQLRMYTDNSLPVRTPSYRIFLATQHLFKLNNTNFLGFSIESGHYSNGQDGCAFNENFGDGTNQCNSIYDTITKSTDLSEILNRKSGNFSTNLTEIILNYRSYKLDDDDSPRQMSSVNIGYTLYHNKFLGVGDFGGFTNNDIKLYGRHRFLLGLEFMNVLKKHNTRYSIKQNIELIHKPHNSVNPLRFETVLTIYPFEKSKAIGFFGTYISGHDNFNFRFVDSGNQFSVGITWSQFPPIRFFREL
jgi:hypothetical protein